MDLFFSTTGRDGADGIDGAPGQTYIGYGEDGGDGGDATDPTPGEDASDMMIRLSTVASKGVLVTVSKASPLKIQRPFDHFGTLFWAARGGRGGNGANGGRGGDGSMGRPGADATRYSSGGNGGRGGNGGNGGKGSSGAHGGRGGQVTVVVSERDKYLLMSVAHANKTEESAPLVQGGAGGVHKMHGAGGIGGKGGRGGSSYSWTTSHMETYCYGADGHESYGSYTVTKDHTNPGGWSGRSGNNGYTPTSWDSRLVNGSNGLDGKFVIVVEGEDGMIEFCSRYDLLLHRFSLESLGFVDQPTTVEFGDTVTLKDIVVRNVGPMASPSRQRVLIQLEDTGGKTFIRPISDFQAFIPTSSPIAGEATGMADGQLCFNVSIPDARSMEDDFEPFVWSGYPCLTATQLGPERDGARGADAEFQRLYEDFNSTNFTRIKASFPVENTKGLVGLSSLAAGEATQLKFEIKNGCGGAIGADGEGHNKRIMGVQFYLHPSLEYDIPCSSIKFQTNAGEAVNIATKHNSFHDNDIFQGHSVEIPMIPSGSAVEIVNTLRLSESVQPYSRAAIEAEIYLQNLPSFETGNSFISIVQRRKLEVVAEPAYTRVPGSDIVIVTSNSTKKSVYDNFVHVVLSKWFGFTIETYPVSRYGAMRPEFRVGRASDTLREAFRNKLVIVMNQHFKPFVGDRTTMIRPSQLLPSGCMLEASGFDPTTRWLMVGVDDACETELLNFHASSTILNANTIKMRHESSSKFWLFFGKKLKKERDDGVIQSGSSSLRCDIIMVKWAVRNVHKKPESVRLERLKKQADAIKRRLSKEDPLHQYLVEYTTSIPSAARDKGDVSSKTKPKKDYHIGKILVRRGCYRPLNAAVVVRRGLNSPAINESPRLVSSQEVLFAISLALPAELRVAAFCRVLRSPISSASSDATVMALRDVFSSQVLWDIANILDRHPRAASLNSDLSALSPTLASLQKNPYIQALVRDAMNDKKGLGQRVTKEMSALIAQLECITSAKDLCPIFHPLSIKRRVRRILAKAVVELRAEWQSCIDPTLTKKNKAELNKVVAQYIRKERGKFRVRTHQRWRKALNFAHSTHNRAKYGHGGEEKAPAVQHVSRLIECDGHIHRAKEAKNMSMRVKIPEKPTISAKNGRQLRGVYKSLQEQSRCVMNGVDDGRSELLIR